MLPLLQRLSAARRQTSDVRALVLVRGPSDDPSDDVILEVVDAEGVTLRVFDITVEAAAGADGATRS